MVLNQPSAGTYITGGADYTTDGGMTTGTVEALGDGTSGNGFAEMAFSIEKSTVLQSQEHLRKVHYGTHIKTLKQFMV